MKRLVELNENGYAIEVDQRRLLREARELTAFILAMQPGELKTRFNRHIIPLCKAAIEGTRPFPVGVGEMPNITREYDGVSLPAGFEGHWARFTVTATGAHFDHRTVVTQNGKRLGEMEFEDT